MTRLAFPLLLLALFCPQGARAGQTQPNIAVILADDMGWSDLGCYGGEIEPPRL